MAQAKSVVIIGAGSIGIATAYYLARHHQIAQITLVDSGQPMGFTSAQSGENYRNWWPHPAMVAFTNHSIRLMEDIARDSDNRINMTRRGYALATRAVDIDDLVAQLHDGLQENAGRHLRHHETAQAATYQPFDDPDWRAAPDGVDILANQDLIRRYFPQYDPAIRSVIHIRRGGDISGQQLGSYMLDYLQEAGCSRVTGTLREVDRTSGYTCTVTGPQGTSTIHADVFVNAAGPFASEVAAMLDHTLPVFNTFQQKIAFEDHLSAIPRQMPFSIDLDPQRIDWAPDDRAALLADPAFARFAGDMPGAIHCRPDGGDKGRWVKLGWAFNTQPADASRDAACDPFFPEIVLRGAARLNPALRAYYGKLPQRTHLYGGWYTLTEENWPLIGPMGPEGSFMNCAMSGFGTMAACAAGALCADWIAGTPLPDYAPAFSQARHADAGLMASLLTANKGIL